ncbi:MAG: alpha/beta fold hydrolase [Methanosphaera sp.]|nr:alpha/beta fold hydrolase [Methanosphaera sp.]
MIEEVTIRTDNDWIYGLLYLPEDKKTNKYPLVILSHGLSLDHTFMKSYAQKLLEEDIIAFIYDFRGGGYDSKSSGKISDMTIDSEKEDLKNVIEYMKNIDCVDKDRIYLAGHSQGALVTSLVAVDVESQIEGLFLFAPAYVIPDDMTEVNRREKNVLNVMPEYLGSKYIESAKKIKLYDDIKDFKKTVYIFHGKMDTRVPVRYAIDADKYYPNSKLILYPDEEHRFSESTKKEVVKIIKEEIFNK